MADMPDLEAEQAAELSAAPPVDYGKGGQPDWRRTLVAAWLAQLLAMMGFSFVMPFIPFYLRDLGLRSESQIAIWAGLTMAGGGLAMTVSAPVWGVLADRVGRKVMVLRAMFGGAVVLAFMGLVASPQQLVMLRVLQGTLTGTATASVALVSSVTPRNRIGFALGAMQMAVFVGASSGPWLGGMMADHFGYRLPFAITGLLLVTAGMLVLFGVREDFKPGETHPGGKNALQHVLARPGFVGIMVLAMFESFAASFPAPILPLFIEKLLRSTTRAATVTGMILGVQGLVAGLSSLVTGRLSDRLGHGRMLLGCVTFSGIFSALLTFAGSIGQLFGLRVAFGAARGGTGPSVNSLVAEVVPNSGYGRAYGLMASAVSLGFGLGPLAGGVLASKMGLRAPFLVAGALLLVVALVAWSWLIPKVLGKVDGVNL